MITGILLIVTLLIIAHAIDEQHALEVEQEELEKRTQQYHLERRLYGSNQERDS